MSSSDGWESGLGTRRDRSEGGGGDSESDEDGLWAHAQALPPSLLRYVSPQQMEFLAYGEDVDVQVVRADARARVRAVLGAARATLVDRNVLRMRLHTFMALRAQYGAEMRLLLPDYVSNARVAALLAAERADADGPGVLTALPTPRFYGVCYALVHYALAPAAAAGLDTARLLLQLNELFNVRMAKLEAALHSARAQRAAVIQCRNIADMELFAVRRRFTLFAETCAGLDRAHALCVDAATGSASGSAPSSQSSSSYSSSSSSSYSTATSFRPRSVF